MKLISLLGCLALYLFSHAVVAAEPSSASSAYVPPVPAIKAKGYFLFDYDSGKMLAEKGADERMEPASLTKMLTAYVVDAEIKAGNVDTDSGVTISDKAWRMDGSRMFAQRGKQVPIEALLKGVIVQSGNDASVALAEHIGGNEHLFADLMNQYAQRLGMKNSYFVNSTGMPVSGHYTTPRDLATLARALIRDFPESYKEYSNKEFTYNGVVQKNRNKLLWADPSVDGLKTGHTDSAGYCLVASAKKDGMRLIAVVLGTANDTARFEETQKLLTYGFQTFETRRVFTAQQHITEAEIWKGDKKKLALGVPSDVYITIPRGQYKNLNASMDVISYIEAPADIGQPFGRVKIQLDDEIFAEQKLIALEPVAAGSFVDTAVDDIKLMFK